MKLSFVRSIALATFAVLITLSLSMPANTQATTSTAPFRLYDRAGCDVDTDRLIIRIDPATTINTLGAFNNAASAIHIDNGIYDATVYASINLRNSFYVISSGPNPFIEFCDEWNDRPYNNDAESAQSR